jgi:hypothetical protein
MSLCRARVWLRESAAPAMTLLMSWLTSDNRCSSDSISAAFCFASCGKRGGGRAVQCSDKGYMCKQSAVAVLQPPYMAATLHATAMLHTL